MIVLVTGATGQQGGAVTRKLLESDHQVRAVTRRADSEAAAKLRDDGVEVVAGTLDDVETLLRAADGVDAIYGVTTPFQDGMDAEVRQGKNLVDAAGSTGLPLVLSSVGWAYMKTGIPHFESKWEVEQYLLSKGIRHTILGPSYFMDNAIAPWTLPAIRDKGVLASAMTPGLPQAMVAVDNIADMVVYSLEHPEPMNGRRLDLAGDIVTGEESAHILSEVTGRQISYMEVPKAAVEDYDLRTMYEWYENVRPTVDIAGLKADFPSVHFTSYREWAEGQNWRDLLG